MFVNKQRISALPALSSQTVSEERMAKEAKEANTLDHTMCLEFQRYVLCHANPHPVDRDGPSCRPATKYHYERFCSLDQSDMNGHTHSNTPAQKQPSSLLHAKSQSSEHTHIQPERF